MAVYAGMAPSAVSQIETGRRSPNTGSLAKIAKALEVEIVDLFPKEQASLPDFEDERREADTAERLLRFGERMLAWWESEAPERLEAEDEEWLRHTWTMYQEFIAILNGIKPGKNSDPQELLGRLMDINACAQRIQEMVREHNEQSRQAGRRELVLQGEK